MFAKVLVANRGEIARRVFRTCREMGIATVAVFSDSDVAEPHVHEADEAVRIPGTASTDTYLNIEAVLSAAKETGADAIHPGYGFLSENARFARSVLAEGIVWIGPSPEAIAIMGSKLESKQLMQDAGVPVLPSIELAGQELVESAALALGYPLLVKASAGGGGKGMRVVNQPRELAAAIESAEREAVSAFGDGTLFLEKYLTAPRHVEIQVFGDTYGNVISLYERECSVQRRHQKIIEEAPSPAVDEATRRSMGDAAVAAARAVDYVGAGTVEFLYQDGSFYFLEMNTRLQVEHPVTEMVTGLDLVQLQFEVADGLRLPEKGPRIHGHAIEARLYAEDPLNEYLPVTGEFHRFSFPDLEGLRVDAGVSDGSTVSVHYDPMIAKVIAHAPTRDGAASILAHALRQARIHGNTTNRSLLVRILEHPEFLSGETDTHFLQRNDVAEMAQPLFDETGERLSALAAALADQAVERESLPVLRSIPSGWRNSPSQLQQRSYSGHYGVHQVGYSLLEPFQLEGVGEATVLRVSPGVVEMMVAGREHVFHISRYGELRYIDSNLGPVRLTVVPRFPTGRGEDDAGSLHAPMPGKVLRVPVAEGDQVTEGSTLVVMEAMKMEHTLRSPHAGTIVQVLCAPDDQVEAGTILVVVEEAR